METFTALPEDSSHKGQWRGALMVSLICAWTSGWTNNRGTGELRRHRAHYHVTVLNIKTHSSNTYFHSAHTINALVIMWFITQKPYPWIEPHMIITELVFTTQRPAASYSRNTYGSHDDVIKWKHFPRNWPFVRGIHRSRWLPHSKASDAELWCFLWSPPEWRWFETPLHSLWRHCNGNAFCIIGPFIAGNPPVACGQKASISEFWFVFVFISCITNIRVAGCSRRRHTSCDFTVIRQLVISINHRQNTRWTQFHLRLELRTLEHIFALVHKAIIGSDNGLTLVWR